MNSVWNSSALFKIFIKWKWHIITITILGMVIIGASTYLIKPKFKSYAIVYPVNLSSFSIENYTEQMMQIFESKDITDSIIEEFNLSKHYGIDPVDKHYTSTMYYMYHKNISFNETKFESVEIKVLDFDPDTAYLIVNAIIDNYNLKVRTLHRIKTKEVMDLALDETTKWGIIKDSLNKRLQFFKIEYNIQDVGIQVKELTQGIYRSQGNSKLIQKAENQLELINKYGAEFSFINSQYWTAYELYNSNKLAYENAIKEYNKVITYSHIISRPYPSDIKHSPNRALITFFGGLSLFALIIFIIGFVEIPKC